MEFTGKEGKTNEAKETGWYTGDIHAFQTRMGLLHIIDAASLLFLALRICMQSGSRHDFINYTKRFAGNGSMSAFETGKSHSYRRQLTR